MNIKVIIFIVFKELGVGGNAPVKEDKLHVEIGD